MAVWRGAWRLVKSVAVVLIVALVCLGLVRLYEGARNLYSSWKQPHLGTVDATANARLDKLESEVDSLKRRDQDLQKRLDKTIEGIQKVIVVLDGLAPQFQETTEEAKEPEEGADLRLPQGGAEVPARTIRESAQKPPLSPPGLVGVPTPPAINAPALILVYAAAMSGARLMPDGTLLNPNPKPVPGVSISFTFLGEKKEKLGSDHMETGPSGRTPTKTAPPDTRCIRADLDERFRSRLPRDVIEGTSGILRVRRVNPFVEVCRPSGKEGVPLELHADFPLMDSPLN